MADDDIPEDNNDLYDFDAVERAEEGGKRKAKDEAPGPLYRVYQGSKVPVSKALGTRFKTMRDAAQLAMQTVTDSWNECFRYYNNHQIKGETSTKGLFKRGDGTENIVYSNLNVMLPAVYGKDPDFVVNTTDGEDEPFVKSAKTLLNVLFKSKRYLNAKYKIKRAAGMALLTNSGIIKLDYVAKEDSREAANEQLQQLTVDMTKAKDAQTLETIYGQMQALESNMYVFQPSGPQMKVVLPHNLVIDPMAEIADGTDAQWQMERTWLNTAFLKARYMKPCKDEDDDTASQYEYLFKPTHKAVLDSTDNGEKNDALGMVMSYLNPEEVTEYEEDERAGYRNNYYTECWIVWDKVTRRVYLFAHDDWSWPLWVWDDPFRLTQFYPYFLIGFGMSTGGTITVGETSYYLDQQDEINEINRQVARIRRTIFQYFMYNSSVMDRQEAEKFAKALRGESDGSDVRSALGIKLPEGQKLADAFSAVVPPSIEYEALFNKEPVLNTINRISNTSDAIRGVQFKANTTQDAVQTYQDAARMSVGAKVEVIEDRLGDIGYALLEMCVQFMDEATVAGIIGKKAAEGYQQMPIEEFQSQITAEVVGGTTEKPNSMFKKKEAIQISQAIGQFADAAPGAAMMIILRMLQNAFSEVNITPDDWSMIQQEVMARTQRGDSTGGEGGAQPAQAGGGLPPALANLPEQVKQQVVQMKQEGKSDQEIAAFLQQAVAAQGGASGPAQGAPQNAPMQ